MKQLKTITFGIFIAMLIITLQTQAQNKPKKQNKEITEYEDAKTEELKDEKITFQFIENPPVYPGCENLKGKEAKTCMTKKIQRFVTSHFNTDIPSNLNITGVIKILTQFTINSDGKVVNIKARSKYKELEIEAKRVIALLPQMKPGKMRGQYIGVNYTLPIVFMIEEENLSQQKIKEKIPVHIDCKLKKTDFEKKKCTDNKIQQYINKKIDRKKIVKEKNLVLVIFTVDQNGKISNVISQSEHPEINKEIGKILPDFKDLEPAQKNGKNIISKYTLPIIVSDKNNFFSETISSKKVDKVSFAIIDKAPIYPGCENLDNITTKKCMSHKINQLVANNFNTAIPKKLKLKGKIKMYALFTIDNKGRITDINVNSEHKELIKEIKRVINLIPQMKPGIYKGKKVKVRYALPIVFKIS